MERLHKRLEAAIRVAVRFAPLVAIVVLIAVVGLTVWAATQATPQVLESRGVIARRQRDTLYLATAVMLLVVIPVFVLTAFIARKYRESNKDADYDPSWVSNHKLEAVWWGVPIVIIAILSVITYQTAHELDPYKALKSDKEPIKVQVVSSQWKWLFLYPDEGVASVNEFALPVGTPVDLTITSDGPMNSIWIPQLAGQIYAMSGMTTQLHLEAAKEGAYMGVAANITGAGHADMSFDALAMTQGDYEKWLSEAKASPAVLDSDAYFAKGGLREQMDADALKKWLAEAGADTPLPAVPASAAGYQAANTAQFRLDDPTLFKQIIADYMGTHDMAMKGADH
jgi:cytochrome o ubiquinol oxidase subunit 2